MYIGIGALHGTEVEHWSVLDCMDGEFCSNNIQLHMYLHITYFHDSCLAKWSNRWTSGRSWSPGMNLYLSIHLHQLYRMAVRQMSNPKLN